MKLLRKLRAFFRKEKLDVEMSEEMRAHLDAQTQRNVAAGLSAEEARAAAHRRFGGVAQIQERARDVRGLGFDGLLREVRHAFRSLRRNPGFAVLAILTLALGIGATTAIFSVVYGVLLKPLPFPAPDRLVGVYHRPSVNQGRATYLTYFEHQRAFENLGAWDRAQVTIIGRGEPERVDALAVSHTTLPLLRVQPAIGRLFNAEDDKFGGPRRVILTHSYWQRQFGGAPEVLSQSLIVDGTPCEIIGVLPASFRFLHTRPAIVLPMQINPAGINGLAFGFQALGRLKPGITLAAANADIARMIPLVVQQYGGASFHLEPNVHPLIDDVTGNAGRVLWFLLATVGLVLLIACANVANLFLVRAESRQQEFAVRAALGASRGHIARQLLTESLLLGLAGGAVGLLLADLGLSVLRAVAPTNLPRLDEIGLDPAVLFFALAISLVTSLLFGLLPAARVGSTAATALKEGGRAASGGPARQRTRNLLVAAEVAMALVLLIGAGLMIRTFVAMRQVQPGFVRPTEVQTFRVDVPAALVPDRAQMARTHEQIAERLRQLPGVAGIGLSSSITMDGEDNTNYLYVEDVHLTDDLVPPMRRFKTVAPGYFETMGNPLVAGRAITWADIQEVRPVVVISENLAREYWPSPAQALGKLVRGFNRNTPAHEVVGVVGNERDDGLDQPATTIVYWPLANATYVRRTMAYAVRSARVGTPGFLRELQQAVWSVNPNLPLARVQTLEEIHADATARTSFALVLLAIAAGVALLLGVVGIYGVVAYVVAQRTREIGIRMALGARKREVVALVLRQGLKPTLLGVGAGVVAALAFTRGMQSLLFGVAPADPLTFASVSLLLVGISLLACWLPAWRAARIDPAIALRSE